MNKVELSLFRAENLFQRYTEVPSLRDKVSRLYYACYHITIAVINIKADFDDLVIQERTTTHRAIRLIYPRFFSKTKHTQIIPNLSMKRSLELWCNLRNVADYEIIGDQFESVGIEDVEKQLKLMTLYFTRHKEYCVGLVNAGEVK